MSVSPSSHEFLTFMLGGQMCGIPVKQVNDVLVPQRITRAPLSPPAVEGLMNLRGRIVTAVDMRRCLGQGPREDDSRKMNVVVEDNGEMFSLIIDSIGDVLRLDASAQDDIPVTLGAAWREVVTAVYKLETQLLVILDVASLLARTRLFAAEARA